MEQTTQNIHDAILRSALALPLEIENDMLAKARERKLDGYEMMVGLWAEVRALRIVQYYSHPLLERILNTVTDIDTAITALQSDETNIAAGLTLLATAQTTATAAMGKILTDLIAQQTLVGNGPAQLVELQALHTQLAAVPVALAGVATALTTASTTDLAGDTVVPPGTDSSGTTAAAAQTGGAPIQIPVTTTTTDPSGAVTVDTSAGATIAPSDASTIAPTVSP
jgi:hypothetical protein